MKNLLLVVWLIALNLGSAMALDFNPNPDKELPYTKFEIKPVFKFFIGAGSNSKNSYMKFVEELKDDIECSLLLSRKMPNKSEAGIGASVNPKGFKSAHVFWKTPSIEFEAFAPKSAAHTMFFSPVGFVSTNEASFNAIKKSDAIYTAGHKFLVDSLCKDESELIAKKLSIYFNSGAESDTNKFKFGFSFVPSTHSQDSLIEKKSDLSKEDLLSAIKKSFKGKNLCSLAQSYESKTEKGYTVKLCAIQEFGSVTYLDLAKVTPTAIKGKPNKYNPSSKQNGKFSHLESTSYCIGLCGEIGVNDTKVRTSASHTIVGDVFSNVVLSCGIEQKISDGFKAGLCYVQSHDQQSQKLMDTDSSTYKSIAVYASKELRPEVSLYCGLTHYRGYQTSAEAVNQGIGFCIGTKIAL